MPIAAYRTGKQNNLFNRLFRIPVVISSLGGDTHTHTHQLHRGDVKKPGVGQPVRAAGRNITAELSLAFYPGHKN